MTDFLDELKHSWGTSSEQKRRESEYNAEYYKDHKEKWQDNRPRARQKKVTEDGKGIERGESATPEGTKRKNELALQQYKLSEWQRAANNTVWMYEGKSNSVGSINLNGLKDLMESTKASALIDFKSGKLFRAAKQFIDVIGYKSTIKKAEQYYEKIKQPLRRARVYNQHAIDEIARMNKNRKPEHYVNTRL